MNLTDINEIRALLARHGFRFSRSIGQNFLCADWVPGRIADEAGLGADTHKKNKSMRALLTAFGFTYRGNVLVASEPGHDPRRQAYDLPLAKG